MTNEFGFWEAHLPIKDWIGSADNLSFSLRNVELDSEELLHAHKIDDYKYELSFTRYPKDLERPSLWSVLKKWWSFNPSTHKTRVSSLFNREQLVALRDWIDEMLYDPSFGRVNDPEHRIVDENNPDPDSYLSLRMKKYG